MIELIEKVGLRAPEHQPRAMRRRVDVSYQSSAQLRWRVAMHLPTPLEVAENLLVLKEGLSMHFVSAAPSPLWHTKSNAP